MSKIDVTAAMLPQTDALRRILATTLSSSAIADYLFLEAWERAPSDRPGVALRIGQIRRANPQLAAEIRAEITHAAGVSRRAHTATERADAVRTRTIDASHK